jgi:DNA-binding CsgD family transcriptional regulator
MVGSDHEHNVMPTVQESPAMRAATVSVEAAFSAMALCTRLGHPVVSNRGYDDLAHWSGADVIGLAAGAIGDLGTTVTQLDAAPIQCHATELDVASSVPLYVVAFHRSEEPVLPRAAVREIQQNLRHALQLLNASLGAADDRGDPVIALTVKEEEVLGALMAGFRVPTIARDFHVSQSTVRSHLRSIFQKYGVHSQVALFEKFLATNRVGGELRAPDTATVP